MMAIAAGKKMLPAHALPYVVMAMFIPYDVQNLFPISGRFRNNGD
jgi:hypothetical protein